MSNRHRPHILAILVLLAMMAPHSAVAGNSEREVRFATFNASLNRAAQGELISDQLRPPPTSRPRRWQRSSSARGPTCC